MVEDTVVSYFGEIHKYQTSNYKRNNVEDV